MDWSNPIEFYRLTAPGSGKVRAFTKMLIKICLWRRVYADGLELLCLEMLLLLHHSQQLMMFRDACQTGRLKLDKSPHFSWSLIVQGTNYLNLIFVYYCRPPSKWFLCVLQFTWTLKISYLYIQGIFAPYAGWFQMLQNSQEVMFKIIKWDIQGFNR